MNELANWKAPPFPQRKVLEGRYYCRLEPLEAARRGGELNDFLSTKDKAARDA